MAQLESLENAIQFKAALLFQSIFIFKTNIISEKREYIRDYIQEEAFEN